MCVYAVESRHISWYIGERLTKEKAGAWRKKTGDREYEVVAW